MNWVDLVIVATFAVYLIEGLKRGFLEQLLELLGFFLTIFLAVWTYRPIAKWLAANVGVNEVVSEPIGFLLDWVVLQALYSFALHLAYPLFPYKWRTNKPNQVAGVVPAMLKGYVIISIVMTMVAIMAVPAQLKAEVNDSYLGSRFVAQSSRVEGYINRIFGRDVKESLTFLTVPAQNEQIIQSDESVDLKFKTEDVTVDKASEQKMLQLVNEERIRDGKKALVWDEKLAVVARAHSIDMFKRGYFSHQNPDGQSPFDRMAAAGITYQSAGENLAYAANVTLAHSGLMRSPGHRANILEEDFGKVGIGVIDGGIYGKMFTQNFTN